MVWTEGKAAWRAGKVEKSKPGADNLRLTVERMGCGRGFGAETEAGMKCLERALATAFSAQGTWTISLVNSEI